MLAVCPVKPDTISPRRKPIYPSGNVLPSFLGAVTPPPTCHILIGSYHIIMAAGIGVRGVVVTIGANSETHLAEPRHCDAARPYLEGDLGRIPCM